MSTYLSVIIPAHNEENRLPGTLEQILRFLEEQTFTYEVIIVENGSSDKTLETAQNFAEKHANVRVIQSERGKGAAVRKGMLEARGEYRFMCDADLSMPVEEIARFIPPGLGDFDVAIASREAEGAVRYNEPAYRHLGGRGINLIIQLLILPGLNDTQCGFKCFRADVANDIFNKQTLHGWSFDIELLYIARRRGYRITEVPIHWYHFADSKVSALRDAVQMIRDIFQIHDNARRGMYKDAH
ncbi:MAG: glycosyl transferase [Anaerolineales bacterium]|nr:glycosyltransferase family 2 protein [Anaerolineae bacterium]PWB71003.1 MAG: glycosyl transferase [Anaerolineales bacterium]